MPDFFAPLPNETKLKILEKLPRHEQVQLTKVNRNFNELISQTKYLKLSKFKSKHLPSEHTVCKVGRALVILEEYQYPFASRIWLTYENSVSSPISIEADDSEKIRLSMEKGANEFAQALREIDLEGFVEEIKKINTETSSNEQGGSSPFQPFNL